MYYILVCANGERIPVHSRIEIKSYNVANAFAEREDVIKILPVTFISFLIATGGAKVRIY